MTIALNGDRSKTNWTVSGIRQNFSGRTQQTALIDETNGVEKTSSDFTEKQFLDELETMLSKALDSSKTTEALAFAKKIYRNIGRDKDVRNLFKIPFFHWYKVLHSLNRFIMPCSYWRMYLDYRKEKFAIF